MVKSMVAGLLSGSRGTYAAEEVREDEALLSLLGLRGAPEEATVWRVLWDLGEESVASRLAEVQCQWVRRILHRAPRRDLLVGGFFPIFGDGSLLEGSPLREGTKMMEGKGLGLLWATIFAGPLVAAQRIVGEGEGEESAVRAMLPDVVGKILKPVKLHGSALVLLDSLHGDGPTLDRIESLRLHYIVGANKLAETDRILAEQPEVVWQETGEHQGRGWAESGVCVCWIECKDWSKKRLLVGRCWKTPGEFLWHYAQHRPNPQPFAF